MIAPCVRCGDFWASNAGPRENFSCVTRFCPTCISKLPQLDYGLVR